MAFTVVVTVFEVIAGFGLLFTSLKVTVELLVIEVPASVPVAETLAAIAAVSMTAMDNATITRLIMKCPPYVGFDFM